MKKVFGSVLNFTRFLSLGSFIILFLLGAKINVNAAVVYSGDFGYESRDYGYAVVAYTGTSNYVEIPSSYNGTDVAYIGDGLFYQNTNIQSVTIPATVIEVGKNAFRECSNLRTVTFQKNSSKSSFFSTPVETTELIRIMDYAFYGDSNISSMDISAEGLAKIGDYAFYGCSSMTSLTLPNSIKYIGAGAFYGWTNLNSLTYIGVESDWLGITYTKADDSKYDCGSHPNYYAKSIQFAKAINNYSYKEYSYYSPSSISFSGVSTAVGDYVFAGFTSLTSIDLTDVTSVGSSAFENCSALSTVTVTDSLTIIGDSAFSGCTSLASFNLTDNLTSLGAKTFYGDSKLSTIYLGSGLTAINDATFYNCSNIDNITVDKSITTIASNAFEGCSGITKVYVSGGSAAETYFSNLNSNINVVSVLTDDMLSGYSVLFNGKIGIKFYFEFPSNVTSDGNAVVRLYYPTISGQYETEDVKLTNATISNGKYIFTAYIAPKFASNKVGAQLITSSTKSSTYWISYVDYANVVISDPTLVGGDSNTSSYVKKLITYCDAVQKYFGYKAGSIPESLLYTNLSSCNDEEEYGTTITDSRFIGSALVLDDEVSLKLYFKTESDNVSFTFKNVTTKDVTYEYLGNGISVYTINGFKFGIKASDSSNQSFKKYIKISIDGTYVGYYYADTFLLLANNSSDEKLVYLSKATYTLDAISNLGSDLPVD